MKSFIGVLVGGFIGQWVALMAIGLITGETSGLGYMRARASDFGFILQAIGIIAGSVAGGAFVAKRESARKQREAEDLASRTRDLDPDDGK